jgi:hypothetical protein
VHPVNRQKKSIMRRDFFPSRRRARYFAKQHKKEGIRKDEIRKEEIRKEEINTE